MFAPPEVPRNAERGKSEGRARGVGQYHGAAKGSIKAGTPFRPGPVGQLQGLVGDADLSLVAAEALLGLPFHLLQRR
jgi:hypothetical protein